MALVLWILAVLVIALAYMGFQITFKERVHLAAKVPQPYYYPVIGHLWLAFGSFNEMFNRGWQMAGDFPEKIALVRLFHRVGVFLWSPADVEFILSSNQFLDKSQEYRFFQPWLGNGLLISSGETWRTHRRLIAPTFHLNVLKQFIHLFNDNSRALCEKLHGLAGAGQQLDIHDYMSEATVEMLLETTMGVERSTQKSGYDYAMAVMKMCGVLHSRHFKPWLWSESLYKWSPTARTQEKLLDVIHTLTRNVLTLRKAERRNGIREGLYRRQNVNLRDEPDQPPIPTGTSSTAGNTDISYGQSAGLTDDLDEDVGEKKRVAFLDQMLEISENNIVLSDKEVEDEVNTIMFEGHDTTAAASSFFLSLMGVHQDIQERCVAELREIFGDSDRPATFTDTLEMKYLERCIMETLRMFPPVPIIARHIKENVKVPSGYVIPEGTSIVVATFMLHRDPDYYPNPSNYDPDNFLPEHCAKRPYYAFIPFSAGPRSCVGRKYAMLKLKILLSTVLRKFQVKADVKESDFQLIADIILKRNEGFPVRLYPRKSTGPHSTAED